MAEIQTLAILTCDRPEALARCIESYTAPASQKGRRLRVVVADDTKGATARSGTRAFLKTFAVKAGIQIDYLAYEEKRAYATLLTGEDSELRAALEFALFDPFSCGRTTGANRNALLLATLGASFLSVDDDSVGELQVLAPASPDKTVVAFVGDPTRRWPFPNEATMNDQVQTTAVDLWKDLNDHLGRRFNDVLKTSAVETQGLNLRQLTRVAQSRGRVLCQWVGICGDSGYRNPEHLLFLSGPPRDFLVKDERTYIDNGQNRLLYRAPDYKTLTPGGYFQSTAIGLCNRDLLPPFFPVYRGQDILFGMTFQACFPDDWFIYMPYAIRHCPLPARTNERAHFYAGAAEMPFHRFISSFFDDWRPSGAGAAQNLMQLGKHIQNKAALPAAGFHRALEGRKRAAAQGRIAELDTLLKRHNHGPPFWAEDVESYKAVLQNSLASSVEANHLPVEVGNGSEGLECGKKLLQQWGLLLTHWPRLIEKAKNLQSKGISLAQPLN